MRRGQEVDSYIHVRLPCMFLPVGCSPARSPSIDSSHFFFFFFFPPFLPFFLPLPLPFFFFFLLYGPIWCRTSIPRHQACIWDTPPQRKQQMHMMRFVQSSLMKSQKNMAVTGGISLLWWENEQLQDEGSATFNPWLYIPLSIPNSGLFREVKLHSSSHEWRTVESSLLWKFTRPVSPTCRNFKLMSKHLRKHSQL